MLTEPEILTITDVLLHRGVEAMEESFKFLSTGKSEYVLVQPQNYVCRTRCVGVAGGMDR